MRVLRRFPPRRALSRGAVGTVLAVAAAGTAATVWAIVDRQPVVVQGTAALLVVAAVANALWQLARSLHRIEVAEPRGVHLSAARTTAYRIGRRALLRRLLVVGVGVLGFCGIAALARFGPRLTPPGQDWQAGVRLVTEQGHPLRPGDIPYGGFTTAWPEDSSRYDLGAVMLLRLTADPELPTVLNGVVDRRLLAYSKICSHAGCPVGLFRETDNVLHCPCHHAEFDAARGAAPVAGPARRPLPQLPLGVDGDGFLVATAGFRTSVLPAPTLEADS